MAMGSWWGKHSNRRGRSKTKTSRLAKGVRRRDQRRLRVEPLEDRRMLATLTVLNTADLDNAGNPVPGSLRQALNIANSNGEADIIVFSETAAVSAGGTIFLSNSAAGGELAITDDLIIAGPGARKISIVQNRGDSRVFNIDDGDDDRFINVTITGVTISGGNLIGEDEDADRGGAIYNKEIVTLNEVSIDGNSASMGGGGIFNRYGSITINRSSILNNTEGVRNGDVEEEELTTLVRINNATFSGNNVGLSNQRGTVNIIHSTFAENTIGLSSQGNPLPELDDEGMPTGDPPPPTVFTNVSGSIFANNGIYDISTIGVLEGDGEEQPPRSLNPSIFTYGYNIWGDDPEMLDPRTMQDPPPTPADEGTIADPLEGTFPPNGFPDSDSSTDRITDPFLLPLSNYGGSTDVYLPNNDPMHPDFMAISPAIDTGDPDARAYEFEQRGRHFTRYFNATDAVDDEGEPVDIIDVGAAEVQAGQFFVDALQDDLDGQYSGFASTTYLDSEGTVGLETRGDFSIREALQFSQLNPEVDTIRFDPRVLRYTDTTPSVPPTILLTLGELSVDHEVIIQGPTTFELEIDASGNDPTPTLGNADGSRVFRIDDGDIMAATDVIISNLTIMGGDVIDRGGAIYNRENLTIANSWIKQNTASNDGGGIFTQFGDLTVVSSTLSENFAADDGGAIFFDNPTLGVMAPILGTITNTTITDNQAGDRGAGIANVNGDVTIGYSTITLNSSGSRRGSGIASMGGDYASTTLMSTAVSGNMNNDVEYVSGGDIGDIVSLGYNIIGNGNATLAFDQTGDQTGILDPLLDDLKREGGPTPIHKPLTGSPLIDAGDPAAVAGMDDVPLYDQRGFPYGRVFDGLQDGTDVIDVGAYELQGATYVVDTPLDENNGNYNPGNLSLREAIELANINPLPDVITFDQMVMLDQTISQVSASTLKPGTTADMKITDHLTIIGLGLDFLSIDLAGGIDDTVFTNQLKTPLFTIDDGDANTTIDVTIQDLWIGNAIPGSLESATPGGAIYSTENLVIEGIFFVNNSTFGAGNHGGAIYQEGGSLTIGLSGATGNSTTFTASSTAGAGANGGAVAAVNATVVIENDVSFSGNSTTQTASHGGAVYVQGGSLAITESSLSGNITAGGASRGGGLYATGSTVNLTDSNLSGNTTAGANSDGGGFYAINSAVTIDGLSNISLNRTLGTAARGGGLYINGGSAAIDGAVISQNKTFGAGSSGGGLVATNGAAVTVLETAISGNETNGANAHGAGVYNSGADVTLRRTEVSANTADASNANGGGIWSDTNLAGSQLTYMLNSTLSNNYAGGRGGGVYNADGFTQILHSTITENAASTGFFGYGGGIGSFGSASTLTTVGSSIVAGNVGSDVDQVLGDFANTFASAGYNVMGVGLALSAFGAAGDQTNILDPMLGALINNGGLTQTHAVLEGSPAVNAGDPSISVPGLDTDQRGAGFDRVLQGRVDAGAYESDFAPTADADFDGDNLVSGSDFLIWQRGFGTTSGASKGEGDANLDGAVDGADLTAWEDQYGTTTASTTVAVIASAEAGGSVMSAPAATVAVAASEPLAPTSLGEAIVAPLRVDEWIVAPSYATEESVEDALATDAAYEQVGESLSVDDAAAAQPAVDVADDLLTESEGDDQHASQDLAFADWDGESWGL